MELTPETQPSEISDIESLINTSCSEVPLLTEKIRATLASIDTRVLTSFSANRACGIVGVVAGIKPAALLQLDDFTKINLEDLGLYGLEVSDRSTAVSRYRPIAECLVESVHKSWIQKGEADRQIGKLLGYPGTATDYFLERWPTVGLESELPIVIPDRLHGTPLDEFHPFILSPQHYKSELEAYSVPLESATKELLPYTYNFFEKLSRKARLQKKMARYLGPLYSIPTGFEKDTKIMHVK